jgi:hypothetical protein
MLYGTSSSENIQELDHNFVLIVRRRYRWPSDWFSLSLLQGSLSLRFEKGFLDGNDIGGNIMNLFVFTNDAPAAFSEIRRRLASYFVSIQEAAYRENSHQADSHVRCGPKTHRSHLI